MQNPECIELQELVNEAQTLFEAGKLADARAKAEQAVNSCKDFISQVSSPELKPSLAYGFNEYLIGITLGSIVLGMAYYFFKRRKLGVV